MYPILREESRAGGDVACGGGIKTRVEGFGC